MGNRTSLAVYPGMIGMKENTLINLKNRFHSITADIEIPKTGAAGVIIVAPITARLRLVRRLREALRGRIRD